MREQSIELTIYFSNILSWLPLGWMKDYDVWCYVGEKMHLTYYFLYHINLNFFQACLNVKRFFAYFVVSLPAISASFYECSRLEIFLFFYIFIWTQISSINLCKLMNKKWNLKIKLSTTTKCIENTLKYFYNWKTKPKLSWMNI